METSGYVGNGKILSRVEYKNNDKKMLAEIRSLWLIIIILHPFSSIYVNDANKLWRERIQIKLQIIFDLVQELQKDFHYISRFKGKTNCVLKVRTYFKQTNAC